MPRKIEKNQDLLDHRALEQEHLDKIAAGGVAEVFYHSGLSANCAWDGRHFAPLGVPDGYELDLDTWERNGRHGPALLREKSPDAETVPASVPESAVAEAEAPAEAAPEPEPDRKQEVSEEMGRSDEPAPIDLRRASQKKD